MDEDYHKNAANNEGNSRNRELVRLAVLIVASAVLIVILYSLLEYLNLSNSLKSWVLSLLSLAFGIGITLLISKAIKEYVKANGVQQEAGTISMLFSIVSYTIVAIIALYLVHVNVTGLLVSAGFLGIVLGLAAQSTLGNIFSGISMIIAKPFEPGDYITVQTWQYNKMPSTYPHEEFIPGYSGKVSKIGLLYTELVSDVHAPLYVPNGILNQALVINHHRAAEKILRFKVEVGNDVKFDAMKRLIIAELKKHNVLQNSTVIAIEHVSGTAYGIAVTVSIKDDKTDLEKLKSTLLSKILEYTKKQGGKT
ncbi:MAG: mechanosensitive ion channel family protein [Candidatus Marsarchaeota archaeon]|jgi:small-conductance mechanosensitive channel|nr:mechanosensitive ion channel family protein [Candidatus Marsarchaeota archaeon]MCL5419187.1 mechanosensitive ion channel family protein [Candidatus Marsarchaeota archaeon]